MNKQVSGVSTQYVLTPETWFILEKEKIIQSNKHGCSFIGIYCKFVSDAPIMNSGKGYILYFVNTGGTTI